MEQNINLLDSLPLKNKYFFTAKQSAMAIVVWSAFLLIIYLFGTISANKDQEKLVTLKATKQSALIEMAALKEQIRDLDTGFNNDAPQLQPNAIFSYYLEKLTKLTPEGIALELFTFSVPNHSINLSGKTSSAQLLADYLNTINKTFALENQQLTTMKLQKNENNALDFTLSNTASTQ